MIYKVDAKRMYANVKAGAEEVAAISSFGSVLTTGTDKLIAAAVTGKIHRVIWFKNRTGAAGLTTFLFHSGTGTGKPRYQSELPVNTEDKADPWFSGYFETDAGEALYVDIATTAAYVNLGYITFTP